MFTTLLLACTNAPDTAPVQPQDSPTDTQDTAVSWPTEGRVLDHVRLVDAHTVAEDRAVVVVGDTIWAVMEGGQDWPEQLQVQDWTGHTVIPGLIDSHVHLAHSGGYGWTGDPLARNLTAQLGWGVLAVVDVGGPTWTVALRDRVAQGGLIGPRIQVTGPMLTAAGGHPCELQNDPDLCWFVDGDGGARAQTLLDADVDGIKVALAETGIDTTWPRLDVAELAEIAETGARVHLHVASPQDAQDGFTAGAQHLAHVPFSEPVDSALAGLGFESVTTTHSASGAMVRLVDGLDLDSPALAWAPTATRVSWAAVQDNPDLLTPGWLDASRGWADQTEANLATYIAADAPLLAGSDAGYTFVPHGLALHWELQVLVQAGLSPQQALEAATLRPATTWGWDDMGLVAAGYRADLVVLSADPLADIANTQQIALVIQAGHDTDLTPTSDALVTPGTDGFCLDARDCDAGQCDRVHHACVDACETPFSRHGACDEDSWCAPDDGLSNSTVGVCRETQACSWAAQDCDHPPYSETCVPRDHDTSECLPAGPQGQGETCSYADPDLRCQPGFLCSWVNYECYELCDPGAPDTCGVGSCRQQVAAPGVPWFGLCY